MTIKVASYERLMGLESELKELTDTFFKFYNLGDLHRRLNSQPIQPITMKLKKSGLVDAYDFLMVVYAPKLVNECIERYNLETKKILFLDQSILLSINKVLMQSTFGIHVQEQYCDIDFGSFVSMFNENKTLRGEDI